MIPAEKKAQMRATATRINKFEHVVSIREHRLVTDEPSDLGGSDAGPSPLDVLAASLASCTATTIEMYADRKGWDLGDIRVSVEFEPARRGSPTTFSLELQIPAGLTNEQVMRIEAIAARCPVHRTLEGEVIFNEKVTRV